MKGDIYVFQVTKLSHCVIFFLTPNVVSLPTLANSAIPDANQMSNNSVPFSSDASYQI